MKLRKIIVSVLIIVGFNYVIFASDLGYIDVVNDNEYFGRVHQLLMNAKRSIYVIMFSAHYYPRYPDSPSNVLLQDIVNANKRGVEVKVILNQDEPSSRFLFGSSLNPEYLNETVDYLRSNGVVFKLDLSTRTTHAKLIVVDGEYVVVGSTNWSYTGITKNHEANVIIRSREVARKFIEYFEMIWKE